jgi:hypothetical protein
MNLTVSWQPSATIPKDGTQSLVYFLPPPESGPAGKGFIRIAYWGDFCDENDKSVPSWIDASGEVINFGTPANWLPLPSMPS